MVRRYDEPVDVRAVDVRTVDVQPVDMKAVDVRMIDQPGGGGDSASSPEAFVWRGRLYVVLAVLARWQERRAWWRDPAASALLGLRADDSTPTPPSASMATRTTLAGECQVWRVEAAAGRSSPVGVYDLTRTPNATWHLSRVAD